MCGLIVHPGPSTPPSFISWQGCPLLLAGWRLAGAWGTFLFVDDIPIAAFLAHTFLHTLALRLYHSSFGRRSAPASPRCSFTPFTQ